MATGSFRSFNRLNFWVAAAVLAWMSALLRFHAWSQTAFANGWDSYFYLVQLKSLEETGRMHSPEASIIYPFLRLCYRIAGDYVIGMKLGTALLAGSFTAALYWTARQFVPNPDRAAGPLILAAWSVFSPQLCYFGAQYPKNLMGLIFLVLWIGSLSPVAVSMFASPGNSRLRQSAVWAMLLGLHFFTHRFTFVLAVVYAGFWLTIRYKSGIFRALFGAKVLLAAGLVAGIFAVAGLYFPGLFHLVDLGRFNDALKWPPQFAPYSFITKFGLERIGGWWLLEVGVVVGAWLLVGGSWFLVVGSWLVGGGDGFRGIRNPKSQIPNPESQIPNPPSLFPLLCLCTFLLFPLLEWSFTGMAWRFFLVFVLLTPLLVIDFQIDKWRRSGLVFAVFLLCCSLFSWKSYNPKMHDPDYARFEAVTRQSQQALAGKNVELLIAHNALAEFFTFTTRIDAMPWLPEYPVDSSGLWRIATGMRVQTLKYFAGSRDESSIIPLGFQYYLLPEYVWQEALQRAKTENDTIFLAETGDWRNPSRVRPAWLLHRKREH